MNRADFMIGMATAPGLANDARTRAVAMPFAAQERSGRGRLGVAAVDLRSGRVLTQRAHERFPLASTFKLPLVMAVLARVDRGAERLDRSIRFTRHDVLDYSPVVSAHAGDGALSVSALCAAAIEQSDNTAANLLLPTVGGPFGVTAYLRSLRDGVTRVDSPEPGVNAFTWGDPRNTTSPDAMAHLLMRLMRDPVLSDASKTRLLGWMRNAETGKARIRAGVPPGWIVADKTGTTNSAGNDVAILWRPGHHAIVLAVYFAEVRGTDAGRDAAIAGVAREVVRTFPVPSVGR